MGTYTLRSWHTAMPEINLNKTQGPKAPIVEVEWARGRPVIEFPWLVRVLLLALLGLFIVIGAVYFSFNTTISPQQNWLTPLMLGLWSLAGLGALVLLYWMWREFERFGQELSHWAIRLRKGDLSTRMPIRGKACPSRKIREQINAITDDYQTISRMQQQRLHRQERYIQQKKHHLNVLYDVATSINRAENLEDLLNRFLLTLKSVVNAEAATVRLLDAQGQMRLVASIGLDTEALKIEQTVQANQCVCGRAMESCELKVRNGVTQCSLLASQTLFDKQPIEMLAIPLQYREKVLGVYNLFVAKADNPKLEEEHELLISIGQHLGMAIEKAHMDENARTLSIMEERNRLAHELHDSLAQTLASLRFKVRLFDDSLNRGDEAVIWQELEGLEHTIDEAYAELRSLITHFRAPIDGKGVVRVVERLSERFKQETGLEVFLYHNWSLKDLSSDIELEVIRIVQEALANVRKHSQASTVRILMYSSEEGKCSILVEDDGIGLPDPLPEPNATTGEHIGLHVMRERAERIGGEIQFESEPGEGTLVQFNFHAPTPKNLSDLVGMPFRLSH